MAADPTVAWVPPRQNSDPAVPTKRCFATGLVLAVLRSICNLQLQMNRLLLQLQFFSPNRTGQSPVRPSALPPSLMFRLERPPELRDKIGKLRNGAAPIRFYSLGLNPVAKIA